MTAPTLGEGIALTRMPSQLKDEIKARISLVDEISRAVHLKKRGNEFYGLCPFHQEKTPSFNVSERKGFFHCFGCGAHGDVIRFVIDYYKMGFKEALDHLAGQTDLKIWSGQPIASNNKLVDRLVQIQEGKVQASRERLTKISWAQRIWEQTRPATNTLVMPYLRSRGINIFPPPCIRFTAYSRHKESAKDWPVMTSGIQQPDGKIAGVHRTFLARDGLKKAPVCTQKKMAGFCYGGAVRLTTAGPVLGIAEGIESGLSVLQAMPDLHIWAALTMDNMARLSLPDGTHTIILLADADTKDMEMGRDRMKRAAAHYRNQGAEVRIAWPPAGMDFNDLLDAR